MMRPDKCRCGISLEYRGALPYHREVRLPAVNHVVFPPKADTTFSQQSRSLICLELKRNRIGQLSWGKSRTLRRKPHENDTLQTDKSQGNESTGPYPVPQIPFLKLIVLTNFLHGFSSH